MTWSPPHLVLSLFALYFVTACAQDNVFNGTCPDNVVYFSEYHPPYSTGRYNLSYQRPFQPCRTFVSPEVEQTIAMMNSTITDPDLRRLFENAYPNTLDTAIKFHGYAANNTAEELTFIITGDINAMWLRDSANQLQSYLPLLRPSTSFTSLASLYRGAINLHTRYINTSPFCNAFQPPIEANISIANNTSGSDDQVTPPVTNQTVFECKYELDSLAAFLELSTNYYTATNDSAFFGQFQWVDAVTTLLNTVATQMIGTYSENGTVNNLTYTFTRLTTSSFETQGNLGRGSPVAGGTGLVRSFYRPSDDSTLYQLFIPANVMFAYYLDKAASIMSQLTSTCSPAGELSSTMKQLSASILSAVDRFGTITDPFTGQKVYAYEVDGFGSMNLMDDANIPSLLSLPFFGVDQNSAIYQATRQRILSPYTNGYYMQGPVISGIGGPHDSFGYAWPMASIVRILTSDSDSEIQDVLRGILNSTDGLGLIHESINRGNVSDWTRPWFSWANGLFGQMILDLEGRKPDLLQLSYQ